ncbi:MAG: bifunctional diguanylate cyclase/phosphodiesterase [Gallionella sp.]|nr:bifunctional diguanylate cyclase/phosphodiesterase [Gallionella sp.]
MERFRSAQLQSGSTGVYGALLFLDLDRFKTFNDTFGRDRGDWLLVEAAKRIQSFMFEENIVARLDGDEFGVLIGSLDENAESASVKVVQFAERIRALLDAPYRFNGQDYLCSSSIGMTLFQGNETAAISILNQAEMAMYQAKGAGGNTVRFFDEAVQMAGETGPVLEAYLRRALSSQALKLYFQIQVDSELHPLGAEVLLRWNHPTRGLIFPAQFIPLAEESDLILDIGYWVLEAACKQLSVWSEYGETERLTLAVNVSAQQFKQYDFVGKIATLLGIYNITASRLTLELTESIVLNDLTDGLSKMHALKALGVGLAIDNFGTCHFSSTYLNQLPLDKIKIDKRFVHDIGVDPNEAVMVQAVIDMTKHLSLEVVAEGVETEAQLSYLKAQGCRAYQGFLFSKPITIEQFEVLLPQMC